MRKSAMLWLVAGLFFGLVTLVAMGGGGYWVYLTHTTVKNLEKDVEKKKDELDRAKKRPVVDALAAEELIQQIHSGEVDVQNAERTRLIAAIVACTSVIPGVMALSFLVMAGVRFMKKPKTPAAEEEEDEEEEEIEETPVVKKKPKPKAADDD